MIDARIGIFSLGLAACGVVEDVSEVEQHGRACPETVCGYNSPVIDRFGFHELNLAGLANSEGFVITGFHKAGQSYQLRVTDGRIYGDLPGQPGALSGVALQDAYILLDRYGTEWAIRIRTVNTITYPVGRPDPVETYVLDYVIAHNGTPSREWTNLCHRETAPTNPGDPEWQAYEAMGVPFESSVVYEADRIDMETKTIDPALDATWFNIGCSGHTIAKLHLTRNSSVGQGSSAAWRWAERQATLKLLTADYCGDGTAFTVAGQHVVWMGGEVSYFQPPTSIEARWNENGAMCLGTPRMVFPTTADGAAAFPDVWREISLRCRKRTCTPDVYDFGGGMRISGNR